MPWIITTYLMHAIFIFWLLFIQSPSITNILGLIYAHVSSMECMPEYRAGHDSQFVVTESIIKDFEEWGFIMVRNLLGRDEIKLLKDTIEYDQGLESACTPREDGEEGQIRVTLWKDPTDDVTGVIARSEKVAGTFAKLLNDDVYHYYGKMIMKDAKTGGAFAWHQDYGYWYNNNFLFPDMGTVFIPIDDTDRENGCLKIIPKSHKAGRIEHIRVGDQAGADTERVEQLKNVLGLYHMEMKAGDVLFFHSNIVHRSEQNHSDRRRWAYLIAYCAERNTPPNPDFRTAYSKLHMLPNSAIKKCKVDESILDKRRFFSSTQIEASLNGL